MNRTAKNIAAGATGIALAAGAVATGVALANKENREKLVRGVKKANKRLAKVKSTLEGVRDRYQAYQHRIGIKKGRMVKK